MALNPNTNPTMSGRITAVDANYPYASSKDETSPGAGDGTPYFKARADDIFGFQQALLNASSIVPTGNAETILASQYVQVIQEIAAGRAVMYDESGAADVYVLDVRTNQQSPAAYFDGMGAVFRATNVNTGASTVDIDSLGVVDIKTSAGADPAAGDIPAGGLTTLRYDDANSWFELIDQASSGTQPTLFTIDGSVAASAMTLSLEPTTIDFRSSTLGSGAVDSIVVGSTISTVISSGSTGGSVSTEISKIILLAINNAGTAELAWVNISGGNNLDESTLISTTAEGGAGAADAANVIYSTTARSNVVFKVLGYVESTQATAGTWASAPTTIQSAGGQALTSLNSLGFSQTWQDLTGSRALATVYTNSTGGPITISFWGDNTGSVSSSGPTLDLDGVETFKNVIAQTTGAGNMAAGLFCIIPAGKTYEMNTVNADLTAWWELR